MSEMPPEVQAMLKEIGEIAAGLRNQTVYVCYTTSVGDPSAELPHVAEHLRHLSKLEADGVLFGAGVYLNEEGQPGTDGMYIIIADSESEADAIAKEETMHKLGLRTYTLRPFLLNYVSSSS